MAKARNNDAEAKVAAASTETQDSAAASTDAAAQDSAAEKSGEFDYVVVSHFRDKNNAEKVYKPGDSVNRFGEERLSDLISRRLVEKRAK